MFRIFEILWQQQLRSKKSCKHFNCLFLTFYFQNQSSKTCHVLHVQAPQKLFIFETFKPFHGSNSLISVIALQLNFYQLLTQRRPKKNDIVLGLSKMFFSFENRCLHRANKCEIVERSWHIVQLSHTATTLPKQILCLSQFKVIQRWLQLINLYNSRKICVCSYHRRLQVNKTLISLHYCKQKRSVLKKENRAFTNSNVVIYGTVHECFHW